MKLTLTLLSLAATIAYPDIPGEHGGIDLDGDGRYSLFELLRVYPSLTATAYSAMDLNGDGLVTPGEFRAGQDSGLLPAAAAFGG